MRFEGLDWIEVRIQLNYFEIFVLVYKNELEFITMKRTLKLIYKTVSIKPCINIERNIRISQFSHTVIFVT